VSVVALAITLGAVAVAAIAAVADGALLGGDPEPEPPQSVHLSARQREYAHRALALTRVLAHLIAGAGIAITLVIERGDGVVGAVLAFTTALLVTIVVEGIGRSYGFASAGGALRSLTPFVRAVEIVLGPVLKIGEVLDRVFERLMPLPTLEERAEQREEATEQFRQVVAAEAEATDAEEQLLHGVFSLGDTAVREIMVPRVDIVGIDRTTPWSEVVDRVRSSEHARFPVYDDTLDDIVGILYAKDLLPFVIDDDEPMLGWQSLVRNASFIPTSKAIDDQLREFKSSRTHIAIVSDEFGGTAGLVTIEDVLEEIVGEIHDEYDVEEPEVVREGDSRFWVDGRVGLEELGLLLGQDFMEEGITTVGGLVYESFGRVPRAGESVVVGAYRLVVERVRGRRIARVYFERQLPAAAEADE
jgi:putative hemolysin